MNQIKQDLDHCGLLFLVAVLVFEFKALPLCGRHSAA
jgi:hypothetical protein